MTDDQTQILPERFCGCPEGFCEKEDGLGSASVEDLHFTCQREYRDKQQVDELEKRRRQHEGGRIDLDELFMEMAELWARRSTCLRGHTAAVIARGRRPISVGYNGAPPGLDHCTEVGCEPYRLATGDVPYGEDVQKTLSEHGCQRTVHAEINAIAWAARAGIATMEASMFSLSAPCLKCAQAIVSAGITELVYRNEYRAQRLDILEKAGVKVRQLT